MGVAALKDASLAAFVALVLAFPIVGFETVEQGAGIIVHTRFTWVAIGGAAVFAGRLALSALGGAWPAITGIASRAVRPLAVIENERGAMIAGAALVFVAVALPVSPFSSRYVIDVGTTALTYVMLGWGLNVVVGLAGLLDLGYVAFYAIGAYTLALAGQGWGLGFWEALPLCGLFAAMFGIVLGFPVLRLRGDYLAIVTLGFGEIIRIVLLNWSSVTGGPNGIADIPRPLLFGMPFLASAPPGQTTFADFFHLDFSPLQRMTFLYYALLACALAVNFFTLRLRRLPIGRAWEALREDEIACRALGIDPTRVKLSAFAIGAMVGGFAGAFFAAHQGFISPESFTFQESATILAIVVLGGMGSQLGVVIAAVLLATLPEFGRVFAEFRMLVFGGAMIGIMLWRPQGIMARRAASIRLGRA